MLNQILKNYSIANSMPSPDTNEYIISIEGLNKSFGQNHVLHDINLYVKQGENLVILGKSGSGKSVLIKCMVRLLQADSGRIEILGKQIPDLNELELNETRKKIGFLFQSAALYDSMSVRENLEFPLRSNSILSKVEKNEMVIEALKGVGLVDAIDLMPSELSGGMRKRIGLARTMILQPEIMLYDEPTTGLDPITAKEISKLILEIQKKNNTTSIIITHDIACAKITANRLVLLKDGHIEAEGTFDELQKSKDEWIESFFV